MRHVRPVLVCLLVLGLVSTACVPVRSRTVAGERSEVLPAAARVVPPVDLARSSWPFEQNVGQWDRQADFVARAGAMTAFYTASGVTYGVLAPRPVADARVDFLSASLKQREVTPPSQGWAVRQTWIGATGAGVQAEDAAASTVSYFRGAEESWLSAVPTFERLRYVEAWPGVDVLVDRSARTSLKSTYVVQAGANPDRIRVSWEGAPARLAEDGSLVVSFPFGELRESPPVAWQETASGRTAVAVRFDVRSAADESVAEVGFQLGAYDPAQPLIIDPSVEYSTFLGGGNPAISASDMVRAVAVDNSGSIYAAGQTYSIDFPTTPGAFDTTYAGGVVLLSDAFVTKFSANGSTLVYSTFLGDTNAPSPTGEDLAYTLQVDSSGAAYVTGFTGSTNFPVTPGAFQPGGPIFVTKLRADGAALIYSGRFGGAAAQSQVSDSFLNSSGELYLAGFTASATFPTTGGAYLTSPPVPGQRDAFVFKMNAAGSAPVFSTLLGGTAADVGTGVQVDSNGAVVVSGGTESADFPTTAGVYRTTLAGGSDGFVARLNAAGSALLTSTYIGGTDADAVDLYAIGSDGSLFLSGNTGSAAFPTTAGAFDRTFGGVNDGIALRMRSDLQGLVYSTYLGGSGVDSIYGAGVDADGVAYLVGGSYSGDFPVSSDALDPTLDGPQDVVVVKLSADGSRLVYSSFLGGGRDDSAFAGVLVGTGRVVLGGYTQTNSSTNDFPTTAGAFDTSFNAYFDGIVVRYSLAASTASPGPGPGPTPESGTSSGATVNQRPDDDKDDAKKPTDEQRQQRERTNTGNRDDVFTEGNVVEVHLDEQQPYVMMGNRDGLVKIVLLCGNQCPRIQVGDYIEVDGAKQHEQLFEAEEVTVKRR